MRMIKDAKRKPVERVDGTGLAGEAGGYVVRRMFAPQVARAEMLNGGGEGSSRLRCGPDS